jgi:dihydrodipicolinate synthase/N-acetylneuraminate lyase
LQTEINHVRAVLQDGITPAYFKTGLKLRGVPAGKVRPPMRELTPDQEKAVEEGLRALGVI